CNSIWLTIQLKILNTCIMNSRFLLPFTLFAVAVFGQNHFELKDASKNYDVKINVENCDKDECRGKAVIDLIDIKIPKNFRLSLQRSLIFT
ncbi:MAG: hypothetical protein WCJ72_20215, partial [Chryseobacterium sp.]